MQALVTGGAGFIGSTLVDRLLAEDWRSTSSTTSRPARSRTWRRRARLPDRRFSFHRLDVASPAVVDLITHRKPDVIFHLAAQMDVRVSVARPVFDATVNIIGSLNVFEGAVAAGVKKVVFAGSGGTLYGTPEQDPDQGDVGAASRVAVRRRQEGRRRLPLLLPAAARPRVHGARARERVRPAPEPARRGRRRRDLLGQAARPRAADDLRRRRADPRLRLRRRRRRRVRARGREGRRAHDEHRHRHRDERAGALRRRWRSSPASASRAEYQPARTGELQRSAVDPGRAEIHLGWKPFTDARRGPGPHARALQGPARRAADVVRGRAATAKRRISSSGTGGRARPT